MVPFTRVLILEEEALLAIDIESVLAESQPVEVVHHRNVGEAIARLPDLASIHLAIVEARFGASEVVAFTERLTQAGVATVVMSADHASLDLFPHASPLGKPFDAAGLLAACDAARARLSSGAE